MFYYILQVCVLIRLKEFEISNTYLCLPPLEGNKEIVEIEKETTSLCKYNETQAKDNIAIQSMTDVYAYSVTFSYNFKYHIKTFYSQCHYQDMCALLAKAAANLDQNVIVLTSNLALTQLSNWLECSYMLLVTLRIVCVWELTMLVFDFALWSNKLFLRRCKLYLQKESLWCFIETFDHNNTSYPESSTVRYMEANSRPVIGDKDTCISLDSCSVSSTIECVEAQTRSVSYLGDINTFRSLDNNKAEKELNKNLHKSNETEASGLLHSANSQHLSPVATKHLPPAAEAAPRLDLLGQDKNSQTKQNATGIETTGYTINKLPGATASHDQCYETKFDEGTPPLSREETRKNVRPVPKENDVDSLLQFYQKTPTGVQNTSQPHVQDKTKSPSKTVPSSSVSKSHKSLPRRACLVHHKEQYHLDKNLLSQPRATKYLLKVRTEISPGRYMAKLELHCSR